MNKSIEIINKDSFTEEFISRYFDKGFGLVSKSEFELLLFYLLKKYGNIEKYTPFEISLVLGISETRVKNMMYASALRFSNDKLAHIDDDLLALLKKSRFVAEGKRIQFVVPDKFLQSYLNSKMSAIGGYVDYSFNRDVVSVDIGHFSLLLVDIYGQDNVDKLVKEAKESIVNATKQPIMGKDIFMALLSAAASGVGGIIPAISAGLSGFNGLIKVVKTVTTLKC